MEMNEKFDKNTLMESDSILYLNNNKNQENQLKN